MERLRVYSHRKAKLIGGTFIVVLLALGLRVGYLMIFRAKPLRGTGGRGGAAGAQGEGGKRTHY